MEKYPPAFYFCAFRKSFKIAFKFCNCFLFIYISKALHALNPEFKKITFDERIKVRGNCGIFS